MASLFRQFYDYLFPKPDLVDSLPLLSRDFVDPHTVNRDTTATHYIRVSASVRTTRTAQDLIDANRDKELSRIADLARRKRRRGGRISNAVRRFRKLW